MEHIDNLTERQLQLEAECVALGETRYLAEQPLPWRESTPGQKEEADLAPGKRLLVDSVKPLAEAIVRFLEEAHSGKAGRKHVAVAYLMNVSPEQAAYLTARVAINCASEHKTVQATAITIARAIEDHLNLQSLSKTQPGLYRKVMEQVASATTASHRSGVLRNVQKKYLAEKLAWTEKDRALLGSKLLELFEDTTGLTQRTRHTEGRENTPIRVEFTEQAAAWLATQHKRCALLAPIHLPMVAPPRPWRSPYRGGYLSDLIKVRLVKSRSRGYLDELGSIDLTRVYGAVNAVQSTPWRINTKVLDVMTRLWDEGGNVAGLPRQFDLSVPARPAHIPTDIPPANLPLDQQEELKVWKANAAKVHAANGAARSERVALAQKLWIANRFKDEKAIYFPHYLDFRGRLYPFASYVNPQSDDAGKALLEFAEGKALGEDGAFWLAVHLANLWGVDKVSFEDRVQWVHDNEDRILSSALDPYESDAFWLDADKPFQALAACFEWLGYKMHGDAWVSHMPIAMDGSCSGLQHFSMMLRDEVGGAAVNLIPQEKPADIYTAVARRAQELSDRSADAMAAAWKGKVVRKVAKQPTMTMCYSATQYGMQGQIETALRKLDDEQGSPYIEGQERHAAAVYMAGIVWEAIGDTVVAARRAMDWLKEASKVAAEAGLPVRWTTPVGLPVLQEYREIAGERLKVHFGGQRVDLWIAKEGSKLSKRRQASGIAPNFVHSLDSAHLMATVGLGVRNGLYNWCMIHDSFGVHACDTSLLNAVLREAFVEQYTPDVLARFRDELVEQLQASAPDLVEKIPPLPAHGNLDIEAVRQSDFFFA